MLKKLFQKKQKLRFIKGRERYCDQCGKLLKLKLVRKYSKRTGTEYTEVFGVCRNPFHYADEFLSDSQVTMDSEESIEELIYDIIKEKGG